MGACQEMLIRTHVAETSAASTPEIGYCRGRDIRAMRLMTGTERVRAAVGRMASAEHGATGGHYTLRRLRRQAGANPLAA